MAVGELPQILLKDNNHPTGQMELGGRDLNHFLQEEEGK